MIRTQLFWKKRFPTHSLLFLLGIIGVGALLILPVCYKGSIDWSDKIAPSCELVKILPYNQEYQIGTIRVVLRAADNDVEGNRVPVTRIQVRVGTEEAWQDLPLDGYEEDNPDEWHWIIDTTQYPDGEYTLYLQVTDNEGLTASDELTIILTNDAPGIFYGDLQPASIGIDGPPESVEIEGTASHIYNGVVEVVGFAQDNFKLRRAEIRVDEGEWNPIFEEGTKVLTDTWVDYLWENELDDEFWNAKVERDIETGGIDPESYLYGMNVYLSRLAISGSAEINYEKGEGGEPDSVTASLLSFTYDDAVSDDLSNVGFLDLIEAWLVNVWNIELQTAGLDYGRYTLNMDILIDIRLKLYVASLRSQTYELREAAMMSIRHAKVQLAGEPWISIYDWLFRVWEYGLDTSSLEDGMHTIEVRVFDMADNPLDESISMDSLQIMTDNTKPEITLTQPLIYPPEDPELPLDIPEAPGVLTIDGFATDVHNVHSSVIFVDGILYDISDYTIPAPRSPVDIKYNIDTLKMAEGLHTIVMWINDGVGNILELELEFKTPVFVSTFVGNGNQASCDCSSCDATCPPTLPETCCVPGCTTACAILGGPLKVQLYNPYYMGLNFDKDMLYFWDGFQVRKSVVESGYTYDILMPINLAQITDISPRIGTQPRRSIATDSAYVYFFDADDDVIRRIDINSANLGKLNNDYWELGDGTALDGVDVTGMVRVERMLYLSTSTGKIIEVDLNDPTGNITQWNSIPTIIGLCGLSTDGTYIYAGQQGLPAGVGAQIYQITIDSKNMKILAGSGSEGNDDGAAFAASFSRNLEQTAVDDVNVYVCDKSNQTVRKIDKFSGDVRTLAGIPSTTGSQDGKGWDSTIVGDQGTAEFNNPVGMMYYDGLLYVSDNGNHKIRRLSNFK
jgi:hypothetical protein